LIRARIANGWFIFGLTAKDVAALKDGTCLKVDLTEYKGKDTVIIVYGADKEEIYGTLEQMTGAKLPDVQTPSDGG